MNKTVITARGEQISTKRSNISIKDGQSLRKKADVAIIEKNGEIQIIRGIRAGIIKDAFNRDDYHEIYHWPTKKKRSIENVVVLCNIETGEYIIKKGLAASRIRNKTPEGYEVEFSYFKPKKKRKKKTKKN